MHIKNPLFVLFVVLLSLGIAPIARAAEQATDELVAMVIELLGNDDKDVRALGLEQVRSYAKGEGATQRFAAELPTLSADTQVGLLRALADRGDPAAHDDVLQLVRPQADEPVEVAAIGALSKLGNAADVPLLVEKLSAESNALQAAARQSLVDLSGESVPRAIAGFMNQADPPLRVKLIQVLAARRAVDMIPAIIAATSADDRDVRESAMSALGKIAGPKWISTMVPAVLADRDKQERAAAEKAIMAVCARVTNPDDRAKPLIAAMENLDEAGRMALLSTMGRVGGSAALQEIEKAIADEDPIKHEMGLKALSNWPNASIAPRYIELIEFEQEPAHRLLALRALIRVAPLRDKRSDAERLQLLRRAMDLCSRDTERDLILSRARAIRSVETLRFVAPYMDEPEHAEQARLSVVELAHHRSLREPNKAEFHKALDKVIETSEDATVVDRANRYKNDKTWVRPK